MTCQLCRGVSTAQRLSLVPAVPVDGTAGIPPSGRWGCECRGQRWEGTNEERCKKQVGGDRGRTLPALGSCSGGGGPSSVQRRLYQIPAFEPFLAPSPPAPTRFSGTVSPHLQVSIFAKAEGAPGLPFKTRAPRVDGLPARTPGRRVLSHSFRGDTFPGIEISGKDLFSFEERN